MGKIINLQERKAEREMKEQFFYVIGFVEGRFPQADKHELHELLYEAFFNGGFDTTTLKEFTFLWDTWDSFKGIIGHETNHHKSQYK